MNIWKSLSGFMEVELVSADCAAVFEALNRKNIVLYQVHMESDLTARFSILRKDYHQLLRICNSRGDSLKIRKRKGLYWQLYALWKRPVLLCGILFFLFLCLWIPSRVFFVQVEGNHHLSEKEIIQAAEYCGIQFGASRRAVRSEKVKNGLLHLLPELEWAGVNTFGCLATIQVREQDRQEESQAPSGISSIIAERDGIILSCTAVRGNPLCRVGQLVRRGQVLISGYRDCGIFLQGTQAEGEVFAQTERRLTLLCPMETQTRTQSGKGDKIYSLLIGKKRIILRNDSGIWDSTCGRIYKEYYVTLPGGFQLPLGIGVDVISDDQIVPANREPQSIASGISGYARSYLSSRMIAGEITDYYEQSAMEDNVFRLEGTYICSEMIGRVQLEQIGEYNGENG